MLSNIARGAITALLLGTTLAQDDESRFLEPAPRDSQRPGDYSENSAYNAGSALNLRWETDYPRISLVVWQDNNPEFRYLPDMKDVPQKTSYRWEVNGMDFDFAEGDVFFFTIFAEDDTGRQFSGPYFNITGNTTPQSSASSSESSPATSFTSSPTGTHITAPSTLVTSTPPPTSNPPSQSNQSSSSGGMDTGAKVGIGVGVSLGVVGIAIGVIGVLLLRRSRQNQKSLGSHTTTPPDYPEYNATYAPVKQYHSAQVPQEMASYADAQELPSDHNKHT